MEVVRRCGLEDEGNGGISCVNLPSQFVSDLDLNGRARYWAYLANSRTACVVSGVFSFFTSNIFFGGEGHRRDRRSLPFASASVSTMLCINACSVADRDS